MDAVGVSELTEYIRRLFENDGALEHVLVRGEVSNYKRYPSGHHYFTLKDDKSVLRAVMFRGDAESLSFRPADGMSVLAAGRVSVYPRDGQYQLYCKKMMPDGAGTLTMAYEELKKRLEAEGLFDPRHKKPLPPFPRRVALVTSPAGAAVRDMIRILGRRWPLCEVVVAPVRVQGEEAPAEIVSALRYCNKHNIADVIIAGRGGGSLEDLWAFNDERVARALFASAIPVVSAVGHEPDFTIADYVADVRAATPSHAAEIVAPGIDEWFARLAEARRKLSPARFFADRRQQLDRLSERLAGAWERGSSPRAKTLAALAARLDALSPLKVLARGYSVVRNADGAMVKSVKELAVGDAVDVRLREGRFRGRVEEIGEVLLG
ncbi:MAG: exodeoxyribonuclease VII large subunit [Oscillospiraceae bacterium]|jgi:exodeoxyribonuclease VII large subunit|nr:exodeoxyribonuclease VII large subunit [Oscillospiraceae bacterium]